jgi:NitT/TauT family transport system substrate-binding protein
VLALGLAACGGPAGGAPSTSSAAAPVNSQKPAASAAGSAAASAKPAAKLIVATSSPNAEFNLPIWVAQDAGIFTQNGIDLELRPISGASVTTSALLAGEVQFVNGGGSEVVGASAAGSDLVVLGITSPTYADILEVPASIKTPEDLKGKTLGVPGLGGTFDIASRVALRKLGLEPGKDTQITAVGASNAVMTALLNGKVDASVVTVPDTLTLEDRGFHPMLNLAEAKLPAVNTCFYTFRAYTRDHPDVVQAYADSIVQGIARLKRDKPFTVGVLKKNLKLDDERAVNAIYDFFSQQVYPSVPLPKTENFADAIALLAEKNPQLKGFDASKIVDPSFVQQAAARGLDRA